LFDGAQPGVEGLRLDDLALSFEHGMNVTCLAGGDLPGGDFLQQCLRALRNFLGRAHGQWSGLHGRLCMPRQDVSEKRTQRWNVPFEGLQYCFTY
jgi:hypothetical protein